MSRTDLHYIFISGPPGPPGPPGVSPYQPDIQIILLSLLQQLRADDPQRSTGNIWSQDIMPSEYNVAHFKTGTTLPPIAYGRYFFSEIKKKGNTFFSTVYM